MPNIGRSVLPALAAFAAIPAALVLVAPYLLPLVNSVVGGSQFVNIALPHPADEALGAATLAVIVVEIMVFLVPRAALPVSLMGSFTIAYFMLAGLGQVAGAGGIGFTGMVISTWLMGWHGVKQLADYETGKALLDRLISLAVPVLFGAWLLILWELAVRGYGVPGVLLPAPSQVYVRLITSVSILMADFKQTFLHAVLIGYAMGCGSGFIVALLIDRSPFLQRGLLPVGNLVSALPIIGVAPIMVMWFGFDWQSKAAVVVIMTFFPMLVNTGVGLAASQAMSRDLMKTYAAGYWQTLFKLRLPEALPFIFNALKINSTLAMIGAIVAEFFGTPIVGMGFRISTEVGRLNVDMVWAEIAVAAVAGSAFYGIIAMAERAATFWHPSYRN
ncbi:MAG: ABC transporter permease [Alphaproteobacteria bacterium]